MTQARNSTRYARQKTALEIEFSRFLLSLSCPKTLSSALPADVVAFLVWKDQDRRTLIHKPGCGFALQRERSQCACLKRLAFGTVDSVIGKLREIFVQHGGGTEWHSVLSEGNPTSCRTVKDYLASVREEQLRARVTPRQADPVLLSDVEVILRFIQLQLRNPALDAIHVFVLARDQALFKALFFSADRAADLLGIITPTILRFPDNSGFLFNHVWTKTLRSGDANARVCI